MRPRKNYAGQACNLAYERTRSPQLTCQCRIHLVCKHTRQEPESGLRKATACSVFKHTGQASSPPPGLPVRSTAGTGHRPPLKRGLWNIFFSSQNRTFVLYLRSKPEGRRGTLKIEIASQKRLGMTRTHKRDRFAKEARDDENMQERSLRKCGSR